MFDKKSYQAVGPVGMFGEGTRADAVTTFSSIIHPELITGLRIDIVLECTMIIGDGGASPGGIILMGYGLGRAGLSTFLANPAEFVHAKGYRLIHHYMKSKNHSQKA